MASTSFARAPAAPAARVGGRASLRTTGPAPRRPAPLAGRRVVSPLPLRAVIEVNEDTFEDEVLKSEQLVLVDYWATWCGPCKLISPIMDWADKEYPDLKVVKIETDPNPNLVEKYKVYGLPTLMMFKDGELVEDSHHEGAISKKTLAEYLSIRGAKAVA
eukprot:jgi/Tetstr1/453860/TSEL_040782.t1